MDQSFAVVLPLRKKVRIDPGDLIRELRLLVEETGATVRMDPRMMHQQPARSGLLGGLGFGSAAPETVAFELDGVRLRVSLHGEPFADKLEMGRFVNPVMWEHGLGEFTDHRAYFKIYEAGIEGEEGPDATFDRAAAVTATASVVARLTEPVGAIWLTARNSVPMRAFGAALEQLKEGAAPLSFWLRWHVIAPGEMEDFHSGIVTGGLAAFTGREIMAKPSKTETRVMIDHAFELARRMIDEKLAISDNQTVEGEGGAKLRARFGGRNRKGDMPVCEIALVQPASGAPGAARGASAREPGEGHFSEPVRIEPGEIAAEPPIRPDGEDGPPRAAAAGSAGPAPEAGPADPRPRTASASGGRRVIRLAPGPSRPRG